MGGLGSEAYFHTLRSCQSAVSAGIDRHSDVANSSPKRAYLLEAMFVIYARFPVARARTALSALPERRRRRNERI